MEKEKLWCIELSDITSYEIKAETEEEAIYFALEYWNQRVPEIIIKEIEREKNK